MQYLGMIAGILNKLGRIGVILGFAIGNAILTYVANGNTVPIITIREILIASLGLLLIPKEINIDISDIVGRTKMLPATGGQIEGQIDTIYKLNSVSETISEMAQSYNEVAATTIENDDIYEDTKNIFKEELLNNIEDLSDNILYEDLMEADENVLDEIYDLLEKKEEITNEDLISVLENNNNYIIDVNNDENDIQKNITQIVKSINHTYRINKLNLVWKQREASNKKILASQLRRRFKSYIIIGRRY